MPTRAYPLLILIVLVGLATRFAFLASDSHGVRAESVNGEVARDILNGHAFSVNDRAIGYVYERYTREHRLIDPATVDFKPLDRNAHWRAEAAIPVGGGVLLAGLWAITGNQRYLPLQILQALLDALAALLVYRIARRLFDRRGAAMIAAGLYAVYPPIAWTTTNTNNDILAVDFTIAIVACFLEAIAARKSRRRLIACGILTGLGSYFRPNVLILPALLALTAIPALGPRGALRQAFAATTIAASLLIPWTIRNYEQFHAFIPTRGGLGQNLWNGLGETPNDFGATENENTQVAEVRRAHPDLAPLSPAWDAVLKQWSTRAIRQHPGYYLKTVARRALRTTVLLYDSGWMRRGTALPFAYGGGSLSLVASRKTGLLGFILHHPLDLIQDALQSTVFLLAMLTLGLTWRRWRRQNLVLIAILLGELLPYILIHSEPRYILPTAFIYLIWIGLGLDLLADRVRQRSSSYPRSASPALGRRPAALVHSPPPK